jgi:hypothetical protein
LYELGGILVIGFLLKLIKNKMLKKLIDMKEETDPEKIHEDKLKRVKLKQVIKIFGVIYETFVWNMNIAIIILFFASACQYCLFSFKYSTIYSHWGRFNIVIAIVVFSFLIMSCFIFIAIINLLAQIIIEEKKD